MKNLEEMTSKELKARAKREGVPSWWTLSKAKLIEGIRMKTDQQQKESAAEVSSKAVRKPVETISKKPKQNTKADPKKPNLRLSDLTYKGETKSIREWAEIIGMPWPTLYDRVNRNGWTVEDAIEIPLGQRRPKGK